MSAKRPAEKKERPDVRVFGVEENPCVWMRAEVVNYKLCNGAYDCLNCSFDKAMSRAWGQEPEHDGAPREGL